MRCHYHDEAGDAYCEECVSAGLTPLDPGDEGDCNTNEVGWPENCMWCNRPVEYSLTPYGVECLIREMVEALEAGTYPVGTYTTGYYVGMRFVELHRDWAHDLQIGYGLGPGDKYVTERYLEMTQEKEPVREDPVPAAKCVVASVRRRLLVTQSVAESLASLADG